MKSKTNGKKQSPNEANTSGVPSSEAKSVQEDIHDDDLSNDEVKGLDEALRNGDIGEPVTLQEFKKMAKKWSRNDDQNP